MSGLLFAGLATAGTAPARAPLQGCAWEHKADPALGLEAWVQRCDFGSRKVDFVFTQHALAIRYSDGGAPEPLVEVIALRPGETPEAGIRRHFAAHTGKKLAARCILAAPRGPKPPAGTTRYTFVPDAAYRKQLAAHAHPDEIGEPPCGAWGEGPEGLQYYQAQDPDTAHRVLFVRYGQEEPLFDEATLRLTKPRR